MTSLTHEQLAQQIQTKLSWLATYGKTLTLKELGIQLSELDDQYTTLYLAAGASARLQDFN